MNVGVEIKLKQPDDFLKIRESLQRIGVASKKENILYQTCHILHKRGQYYILHFKELFILDGKDSDFDESDLARRNKIAALVAEWGLCELVNPKQVEQPQATLAQIKILTFAEKKTWQLCEKYHVGKKRKSEGTT